MSRALLVDSDLARDRGAALAVELARCDDLFVGDSVEGRVVGVRLDPGRALGHVEGASYAEVLAVKVEDAERVGEPARDDRVGRGGGGGDVGAARTRDAHDGVCG